MTRTALFTAIFLLQTIFSCAQNQPREINNLLYLHPDQVTVDSLQRLNLVLPEKAEQCPLFLWIGGGAWSYGDRHVEMDFARKMAEEGIAVASIGHRLSPAIWRDSSLNTGIQHPKHIQDVAAAVKWLVDHANDYGYDTEKIFIGGYSSGAHLAALLGLDESYLIEVGLSSKVLKGIIPISGAYDIASYHDGFLDGERPELATLHVEAVFGPTQKDWIHASPTSYLVHLSAPMLVISDNNMYNYTRLFEDRIRETDFRNMQVVYAYDLTHGGLWKNLSFAENSIYRTLIVDFIFKQFPG